MAAVSATSRRVTNSIGRGEIVAFGFTSATVDRACHLITSCGLEVTRCEAADGLPPSLPGPGVLRPDAGPYQRWPIATIRPQQAITAAIAQARTSGRVCAIAGTATAETLMVWRARLPLAHIVGFVDLSTPFGSIPRRLRDDARALISVRDSKSAVDHWIDVASAQAAALFVARARQHGLDVLGGSQMPRTVAEARGSTRKRIEAWSQEGTTR